MTSFFEKDLELSSYLGTMLDDSRLKAKTHESNLALSLFLEIKCYWNTMTE